MMTKLERIRAVELEEAVELRIEFSNSRAYGIVIGFPSQPTFPYQVVFALETMASMIKRDIKEGKLG